MRVIIDGDANRGYDGILKARFLNKENDETYELSFDVDKWISQEDNGIIGGQYISIVKPEPMILEFDQEYEFDLDTARKVYEYLAYNGWKPEEEK
jgi:hypothetical protein